MGPLARGILRNPRRAWLVFWGKADLIDPDSAADLVIKFIAWGPREPDDQQARIGLSFELQ